MTRPSWDAILFLLVATLAALLAFWALFPGQPAVDAPEPGTSPARPATLGPESRSAAPEPAPRAMLPEATPSEPDAAEEDFGHCLVRVVQKEGGQPAPGATVFLRRWARLADGDQEAFLARHGDPRYAAAGIEGLDQIFIADAGGRALLPAPGPRDPLRRGFFPTALAAARWGELTSGFVKLPASATDSAPEILLEVGPEQDLEVQTVDAAGRPRPGVPVGLFGGKELDRTSLHRAVTAGEQALARFPHASRFVRKRTPWKYYVGLDFPVRPEEECFLDVAAERPPGPFRLICPPTGSVVLNLVEEDGRPIAKRAWAWIACWEKSIAYRGEDDRRRRINRAMPAVKGTVAFPLVGLGVELAVQVFFEDRVAVASDRFRGPWMPGQEIVHTIRCPRDRTFSGRLWAPDGSLAVKRRILVWIPLYQEWEEIFLPPWRYRTTANSDSGGLFSFGIPDFVEASQGLLCRLSLAEDAPQHRAPWAILRTPPSLEPGNVSIGEVRLQAIPVALAGRVMDPGGKPLTGVSLTCEARVPESKGEHPGIYMTVEGPDADGAFTAYGPRFFDTVSVRATKKGFTKVLLSDIGFGERNLVIVMGEATRFSCPVLLDPELAGTPAGDILSFIAKPRTGPGDPIHGRIVGGRASVTGLSPGRYDFVIGIRIGERVDAIKTFEDIAIVAGPNPPPGLPGETFVADLRGLVRLYTLFVHDSGGKQVEAWFEGRGTLGRGDGSIQILILPGEAPDLVLVSPGRPSKRVSGLPSGSRVQMDP